VARGEGGLQHTLPPYWPDKNKIKKRAFSTPIRGMFAGALASNDV